MLTFFNVSEEDYGNYTCVAINTMGITNASIILYGEFISLVDQTIVYIQNKMQRSTEYTSFKHLTECIIFQCDKVHWWHEGHLYYYSLTYYLISII